MRLRREFVHYEVTQKVPELSRAIVRGFGARAVPVQSARFEDRPGRVHLVCGLQFGALEVMQQVLACGADYVFFDRAYFGGGPGSGRWRATFNRYQQNWVRTGADPSRLAKWGVQMEPRQPMGEFLLVVPPGEAIRKLFGLGDWEADACRDLRRLLPTLPIRVSRKGDPVPLAERLHGCAAVFTYTSNVAVEAVLAGVQVMCSIGSAAAPVAWPFNGDRGPWAASLAAGQFTLDEIANGFCKGGLGL